jgi:hypothetical protein
MSRHALQIAIGLAVLAATVGPARAQMATAEVRTFAGQTYRLTDASLEVLYTIMLPKKDEGGPSETAPTTGARAPMLFGSAAAINRFLDKGPEPLQGRRQSETLTLHKDGVEMRVPLAELSTLSFMRQRIRSGLPPHVAPEHYRYAATAVLLDGTRLEGDYVNLGTTFVRGRTPQGRIDIPWEQIETVRFTR